MSMLSSARNLVLILLVAVGLLSCRQGNNSETAAVQSQAYLEVAQLYLSQGQFRSGIIEAQNALQALPGHVPTRKFLGRLYLDIGNTEGALQLLNELYTEDSTDSESRLMLAEAHLNSGNPATTLSLLESFESDLREQQVTADWLRGVALSSSGNFVAAQEELQRAIDQNPQHIPSLIALSTLEFRAGNAFGAQQFIDQAIAVAPNDLDLWIWRGQFALLQQQYPDAEMAFNEALELMGSYDTMTAKRYSVLRAILLPLQMQQKNDEALRYSQIIAESPQGQLESSFSSALSLFEEGDFERVQEELENILTTIPDHPGSNLLLGMARYAQGNFTAAQESLSQFVNTETSSPMVIKTLAATHLRLNQPESALVVLREAVETYPEDGSLLAMIGVSQQSMGDIEESIESFRQAIALQPDSADMYFALAGSLYQNNDIDAAIEQLQRALELNPDYIEAKRTLVDLYISSDRFDDASDLVNGWLADGEATAVEHNLAGRVAFLATNYEVARSHFENTLHLNAEDNVARLFLARIGLSEQDYGIAETYFRAVIESEPNNVEALSGLLATGTLDNSIAERIEEVKAISDQYPTEFIAPLVLAQYYISQNALDIALPHAEVAFARNANNFTLNTLSEILFRQIGDARRANDLAEARLLAARALELRRNDIQALIVATGVESQAGNYEAAFANIDEVKALQPNGSSIGIELEGDLFLEMGNNEGAVASYRQAWQIVPSSGLGLKLFRTLSTTNESEAVTTFLTEWITTLPEDPIANAMFGMSLQEQNRIEEAISHYETTYRQQPENIVALNNLAWLYQDSNPERALQLSSRAAELYPESADVLDTYGWILLNQGDRTQAVEILERAAQLAPDSESIAEHLEAARQ